jgi:hypothetical protein
LIEQLIGLQREMLMANRPILKKELEQARRNTIKDIQSLPFAYTTVQAKNEYFLNTFSVV